MSLTAPPDGHWHRRTPDPIKTDSRRRWYGCTETTCDWQVAVNRTDRSEIRFPPGHDHAAVAVEYAEDQ